MKQKINVGMIGLGTVGTGALRILRDNAEPIRHRLGVPIEITKIAVRDLKRDRGLRFAGGMLTDNGLRLTPVKSGAVASNNHPDAKVRFRTPSRPLRCEGGTAGLRRFQPFIGPRSGP